MMVLGFYISNYHTIARLFKNRVEQKEADLDYKVKLNKLNLEEKKLDMELAAIKAPFEAETKALRAKSEEEHKQFETARKQVELELKRLMLPEEAKIESVKRLADQQERLAKIEIEKAQALAEIEADKLLELKLGEFDDYRQVRIKGIETKIKVKEHKMAANEKYLAEFLNQEDYNGQYDDDYTYETPELPYRL